MSYNSHTKGAEPASALSLLELTLQVRLAIEGRLSADYWLCAEMSDVRTNASSGHCYLEFIDKNPVTGQIEARARGSIWAKPFALIRPYFEQETGQRFASGLKVLVKVSVEFHPLYGFSLNVLDIDPTYTLGDMARRRLEIIRQLKEEGVFTLNKELPFPTLPQRIAVITSATAAGYEDFLKQLTDNRAGYAFYIKLFPAVMQGEKTESSVIAALDAIYPHADCFDVVVIIRGGGATSELSSFDSYLLAANCAQFPLPIISGIGHERDDTLVDLVAHTRQKTPTAVAEFLVGKLAERGDELAELQAQITTFALDILQDRQSRLQQLGSRLPNVITGRIAQERTRLQGLGGKLSLSATSLLQRRLGAIEAGRLRLAASVEAQIREGERKLQLTEQFIKMASPEYILKRGYSLTLKEGKIIKQAADVQPGDTLQTRFSDGSVYSTVHKTN